MDLPKLKKRLKSITPHGLTEAILQCEELLDESSSCYNDLLVIKAQYNAAKLLYRKQHEDATTHGHRLARLTSSFLALVDEITEYDLTDRNKKEEEHLEPSLPGNEKLAVDELQSLFSSLYKGDWGWFKKKEEVGPYFKKAAVRYAEEIWARYNSIRVFGMSNAIPLEFIYVRVNILEKIHENYRDNVQFFVQNFDLTNRNIKYGRERPSKTGLEIINSIDKIIVLGKPGAGKSTYLKYLALESVREGSKIKDSKIPIFVTLTEFADRHIPLIELIKDQFDICSLENSSLFIQNALQHGKCLFLLDGLDEVPEGRKKAITKELIEFSEKYRKNQFIISCRVAAYGTSFKKFADVELADFNDEQIKSFIRNWFINRPETGNLCWDTLKNEVPLKELAKTPLLLTLLCIAYEEKLDFRKNRADLYENVTSGLLKRWDTSRYIQRFEPYKRLSLGHKKAMFHRIAAQTFSNDKYFFKRKELVSLISEYIKNLFDENEPELEETAGDILDATVANNGLFTIVANGIYSFTHLSLQEYFTAKYISENSANGSAMALIENHLEEDKWREVFLLTNSLLNDADHFLLKIHQKASNIFKNTPEIEIFLKAAENILLQTKSIYSKEVRQLCALHIILKHIYFRVHREATLQVYDFASEYERGRDHALLFQDTLILASHRALDLASTLDRSIDFSTEFHRRYRDTFDLNFDPSPNSAFVHALNLACTLEIAHNLSRFLTMKLRLVECWQTECHISNESRRWLLDNLWS